MEPVPRTRPLSGAAVSPCRRLGELGSPRALSKCRSLSTRPACAGLLSRPRGPPAGTSASGPTSAHGRRFSNTLWPGRQVHCVAKGDFQTQALEKPPNSTARSDLGRQPHGGSAHVSQDPHPQRSGGTAQSWACTRAPLVPVSGGRSALLHGAAAGSVREGGRGCSADGGGGAGDAARCYNWDSAQATTHSLPVWAPFPQRHPHQPPAHRLGSGFKF